MGEANIYLLLNCGEDWLVNIRGLHEVILGCWGEHSRRRYLPSIKTSVLPGIRWPDVLDSLGRFPGSVSVPGILADKALEVARHINLLVNMFFSDQAGVDPDALSFFAVKVEIGYLILTGEWIANPPHPWRL